MDEKFIQVDQALFKSNTNSHLFAVDTLNQIYLIGSLSSSSLDSASPSTVERLHQIIFLTWSVFMISIFLLVQLTLLGTDGCYFDAARTSAQVD